MAEKKEEPIIDDKVEKLKVKKPKVKKFKEPEDNVVKVDLKELKQKAEEITKVDLSKKPEDIKTPEEKPVEEKLTEEKPVEEQAVIEEITSEEKIEKPTTVKEVKQPKVEQPVLPENIEKLVNFMKDTGGDINDYVKLNRDYSEMDNLTLLKEYYKTTKPHLKSDEIDFLMEDQFSYDEESDEDKDIKRKKLALKEQVANAKAELEQHKSKYYEEIKAGSKLTSDQQKAIDFFNRYNKESEELRQAEEQAQSNFKQKTENVFNDEFKGFEYNVGDKRFRFNVKNTNEIKEKQSDIGNFIGKFLNDKNQIDDAKGYHKALYTAMNSDAIANHFYEQGKADALKESVAKSKNIDMNPRQSHGPIKSDGLSMKVLGSNSNDFKLRIKSKNNK